ncbi:tRNA-splicing endonuclease subunit SEN54 [Streptomyces misionensis JCM 4497]
MGARGGAGQGVPALAGGGAGPPGRGARRGGGRGGGGGRVARERGDCEDDHPATLFVEC